jgi:PAS domain S-box-containing protein
MGARVCVLHLEDEPTDAELLALALREGGVNWDVHWVDSRPAFLAALDKGGFDIVVSDYSLPSFDGMEALREVRKRTPEMAFVFFTATLGEERAVAALKAGATDFVPKGRSDRLAPALERAVREAEERSARRQAELRLTQSEEQYRLLFESNPHPMWVFDAETLAFLAVNEATLQRYEYSQGEFLGMTIKDLPPPEERSVLSPHPKDPMRTPPGSTGSWKHRTKGGSIIEVELSSNPITFQEREAVLVLANDVTEKVKLEAQLLQSQKMEAIGQLAGGVAHDFNNVLGVITGYAEMLLKDLGVLHPGLHRVEQIQRAAERAGGLTRQLLAFSRKQVLLPEVLELNSVLDETEKMLRRLIGEDVQLVAVFAPGLGLVKADPGQMEQVIVNLAVNARDAMPGGGKLIIETSNVDLDANYTRTHPEVRPGPYVMLAVSDTGHGMNTDTMSRIFEPFFTTKEVGKGTGLGLSTVFGIVKQSGGHIGVYSEVGRGTSFKVYLPRIERSGEVAPAGVARAEALPVGSETILLVEDEEALRQLIREILEVGGYRVLPGGSPEEALAAAEAHSGPIHLLLTDVVMPLMSGRQVADRIKASRPAVRVMYMSGYTDEAISHHGALEPGTEFLQKPFTADALLRKVREVLEA